MQLARPITTAVLMMSLLLAPAPAAPAEVPPAPTPQEKAAVQTAARDANAFALDLYARLSAQGDGGNLFFSPYSIDTALAMTYAGARGRTAEQMAKTLRFSMPPEALHVACGQWIASLNRPMLLGKDEPAYTLVVANALWLQQGYPFNPGFTQHVEKMYGAGLNHVDYLRAADAARNTINAWVEKQTRDKIKDLIPAGLLTPDSRLVLTNAIYFKSAWAEEFPKRLTKDAPFKLPGGKSADVKMMNQTDHFPYAEDDDVQVLQLPYRGRQLSMMIVLPKKADGLAAVEKALTVEKLDKWSNAVGRKKVIVSLPRFKVTASFDLADTLQAMGMTDAFDIGKADFSGMTTAEKLFISAVIHKAFIDVNEEGTEAAAATAVMMTAGSAMPRPEEPVVFNADHPFLFAIRHEPTGSILFLGRLNDPATR